MTARSSAYLIYSLFLLTDILLCGSAEAQQSGSGGSEALVPAVSNVSTGASNIDSGHASNASSTSLINTAVTTATTGNNVVYNNITVIDFGTLNNGTLNLGGQNFVNYSTVYAVSSNPAINQATIQAANVYIAPGAALTTVIPVGGLPGYSNLSGSLSLSIVAANSIVNSGVLSSSANLTLTAPQIYNGAAASTAVMSAVNNVNIVSGNIVNSGLISSALASINVGSITAQNILFNNTGGVLEALRGNVNFRDASFVGKFNTDILGGSILAESLNIFSGNGIVNLDVSTLGNQLAPTVLNIVTGEASVKVAGAINLGQLIFQGDPIVIAENGDIHLIADQNGSGPLHVIAENGSIINDSCTSIIGTGDITYRASGDILLNGIQLISTNGIISLEAEGGSLIAPGAQISTTAVPSSYVPAGPVSGVIPFSVQLFAQNSIEVGSISNPAGVVVVRGGGRTEEGIHYPSTNPGTVVVGNISVYSSDMPGQGGIIVDNFGGAVSTGALNGNGSRIQIQSSESVSITSPDNKIAAIDNTGVIPRTGPYFQADTIINAPLVNINGPSLLLNDGSTFIGSVVQLGQANINVDQIFASNTLGSGVFFQATSGSVSLASSQVQATNTGNSFSNFNVLAAHGSLDLASSLQIHAEATTTGTAGGAVSLVGSTALNTSDSIQVTAAGLGTGNGGSVKLSGGDKSTFHGQDVLLDARGGADGGRGGSISIISGTGLSVDANSLTVAAGNNGSGGYILLDASSSNPGTSLLVSGGPLNADGNGTGDGGTIRLINGQSNFSIGYSGSNAEGVSARSGLSGGNGGTVFIESGGDLHVEMSGVSAAARGANGDGGNLYLLAGMRGDPSDPFSPIHETYEGHLSVNGSINVDGTGSGYGGLVYLANGQSPFSVGGNSADVSAVSARAGSGAGGGGGYLYVRTGGDLTLVADAVDLSANNVSGEGGLLSLSSGLSKQDSNLNLSGTLDLSGRGSGNGGLLEAYAGAGTNGNLLVQGDFRVAASQGHGGTIKLAAGKDLFSSSLNLNANSESQAAGSISLSSGRDMSLAVQIDAASLTGKGGNISLSAGNVVSGTLSFSGNLSADSQSADAGSINLEQSSSTKAMQIGISSTGEAVSGLISASSQSGKAGSLSIKNGANGAVLADLNQSVRLLGADGLGQVSIDSKESVAVKGPGSFVASLSGSGKSFKFEIDGKSSIIGIKSSLSSSQGDLLVNASASDSQLVFADGSNLRAQGGNLELGAAKMLFAGSSTISMDNAGILKLDSGSQNNSLDLELASGALLTIGASQGESLRPGLIQIGPTGNGSLNIHSSGSAGLEFNGATVSLLSSSGDINLGSGVSINSDAFDSTQNLGMEIVANNGNININSTISARQLNISTIGSGDVNLGSDINSPTVLVSVQGASRINQNGTGKIGIGTLVLSSEFGDIGSAEKPIETDVLELKVTSGGSAYINNAANLDLKTSDVQGDLVLSNDGDLAVESAINAGSLTLNANGSISVYDAVNGANGVTMASASGTAQVQIAAGGSLSGGKNITIISDNLLLDGSISAQGSGAVISLNSDHVLSLGGSSGSLVAGGGNNLIDINGAEGVNFNSSLTMNAGASGTVQIRSSNPSSSGVSLLNSAVLTVSGGSQLNVQTGALSFGSGSTINLSNGQNAMTVQSTAGSSLTVSVNGSNNINASSGGTVSFLAGLGAPLIFNNSSVGSGNLNVNGASLATESTAANTNLNFVNLNSNRSIDVAVHGGTLNLNGDIYSSQNNGVIVLRDPAGITIAGSGTVGFTQGLHGTINVQALSAGADLLFAGNTRFDAGVNGTVSFQSIGSISFAAGSSTTVMSGSTLNMAAPVINFGAGSQVAASGASNINMSGYNSSAVEFVVPNASSATVSTNGGAGIVVATRAGADISFHHNAGGSSAATLNFQGAPVTVQTSNADITIDPNVVIHADNNVSVLAPGGNFVNNGQLLSPNQGSRTVIEAAGPLYINKNVTADSLIVRTTANNGSITLGADLNVKDDLTVSANGSGNIVQTSGLLSATSITLSSGSGNIGSSRSSIKVNTAHLNVSTEGAAYVSAQGSVRVDEFHVGGGLNLKAGGDIAVGAANASKIEIGSSANFNAGRTGAVTISASDLVSISPSVNIKVQDSALNISAASVEFGDSVRISSTGNLTVSGNVSGSDFKLGTSSGNLLVNGDLSGRTIGLSTGGAGNITFNGNVNASKLLTVSSGERGNISQLSGVLNSHKIELSSGSGNIGTNGKALSVSASSLSARTEERGIVNVRAIGNLVLDNSRSGGNFSVSASGNLTVNDIRTERGSIALTGSGAVNVAQNAEIHANQGNLSILNTNASAGTITIGKNAELVALSDSASNGLGNVTIAIGSVPASPVKGSAPSGLKVSEKYGGKAYFGSNGITVNGKNNEVNAWGSNVVFSTGARPKSAISLEGGVYILADPPVAGVTASAPLQESAAVLSPVSNNAVQFNTVNSLVPTSFSQANYVFNQSCMTVPAPRTQEIERIESTAKESSELKSVACVTGISATALQGNVSKEVIEKSNTATSSVYTNSRVYESADSCLTFHNGEMMVNAHHQTEIKAANYKLKVDAGSTVLLKSEAGKGIEIYNVYEKHWGGVKVSVDGREFVLGAGQRLVADKECSVAARNEKSHRVAERTVKVAEFPLISLIANSDVLGKLIHSSMKEDRQLGARLMKMAACLSVVTSSHGAYKD